MGTEPASKRRRKDQSPAQDWEDGEDDDELTFQPFALEAKSDSGYRFSIERAYSDHRFQATMAHIFEKYSRDFDGIGDEIDLMTGEIVVDNGHIHKMRNEGDVGDDFVQVGDDEEDEGILLEELAYGGDEQTGQVEEDGESESEHGSEEQTPQGRLQNNHGDDVKSPHQTRALVSRPPVETPEESWARQPSASIPGAFWPSPYGSNPFGFGFGSGAGFSSPAFSPSPFSFGAPPFPAAPWDIPGPQFEPQWAHPIAQPAQSLFADHRYNFKAQRGQSSIWARRSRYKEHEDEPLRSVFDIALHTHSSGAKPKAKKSLPAPAAVPMTGADDEDEEAVLSGRPVREKMPLIQKTIHISRSYDDDLVDSPGSLPIGLAMTEKQQDAGKNGVKKDMGEDIHKVAPANPPAKRGRKRRRKSVRDKPAESNHEASIRSVDAFVNPDISNGEHIADSGQSQPMDKVDVRRNLSRTREVKSSNRKSDHKAPDEGGPKIIRVEIPSMSRHNRCEYQAIEVIDSLENDYALSEGDERPSAPITKPSPVPKSMAQGINHDLEQDLAQEVGDNEQGLSCHASDHTPVYTLIQNRQSQSDPLSAEGSVYIPSDDEAPPIGASIKIDGRRRMTRSVSRSRSQKSIGAHEPALELRADFEAKEGGEQDNEVAYTSDVAKGEKDAERREITGSTMDSFDAYSEPNDEGGQVERVEGLETDKDWPLESAEFENVFAHPAGCSHEAVPFSSSPTRSLTRFTARISLNNKPHFPREMPWLRTRAATPFPSSPVLDETPSSPTTTGFSPKKRRGRSRSRKSVDAVEQPESRNSDDGSRVTSVTTRSSTRKSRRDSMKRPLEQQIAGEMTEESARMAPEDPSIEATTTSPHLYILPAQASGEFTSLPSSPQSAILHDSLAPQPDSSSQTSRTKKLKTPRHRRHLSTRSPSSRRSITSIISNNADNEEIDELRRTLAAMPSGLHSSRARSASARKIWRSSALTEIYHTPVKKPPNAPVSPGSLVRTPGGTMRACGRNGYRCGRDFCFTCL